jgi:HAD superfamily hydrolase (TIGR01484 family)
VEYLKRGIKPGLCIKNSHLPVTSIARNLLDMQPLKHLDATQIKYIFCDIDDTLTTEGKLFADAFAAVWRLKERGLAVVPVTGRPAGWCDMIARFWPVDAVIGENGAFYFRYDEHKKQMSRTWAFADDQRLQFQQQLKAIEFEILNTVPGAAVSADQFSRLFDLAIDFCEDVKPLPQTEIQKIVEIFKKHGATAKVSSIHVNGWFGAHDKLSMCKTYLKNEAPSIKESACLFVGDSPNDEPMFAHFANSVGVSNVLDFKSQIQNLPKFICTQKSGSGFVELADYLLK